MSRFGRSRDAALAVALVAGLGVLGWFAIVAPLAAWRADALADRPRVAEQMQVLQVRIDALETEQAQRADGAELDILWRAAQTGEATAKVQSELSRLASERGVSLRSISPIRARDMTLAQAAGFRLELEASLDQLAGFLRDIEYHSPALLVERANLRRLNKAGAEQAQPVIFAQLEISGPVVLSGEAGQ